MAHQHALVNKQFNSPIGLYSDDNVREILERESQMLSNGVMGIDFHVPAKSNNLQNSAVLRMLEEEESRQRYGHAKGFRSDGKPLPLWPPPGVNNRQLRFRDVVISGVKRVAWPPPREGDDEFSEQDAIQAQGGPQFTTQQTNAIPPNSYQNQAQIAHSQRIAPQGFNQQQPVRPWTPVPTAPQFGTQGNQSPQSFHSPGQFYEQGLQSPSNKQHESQPQRESPLLIQATRTFEPPPATITLRPTVPISQAPAPIVTSQPATATLRGGKNLRGDLKWPPENVRTRMQQEHQQLIDLAKGPACRPRRVDKDYSSFFGQHALNSTYPGYKIPPGTQFYDHHPVW